MLAALFLGWIGLRLAQRDDSQGTQVATLDVPAATPTTPPARGKGRRTQAAPAGITAAPAAFGSGSLGQPGLTGGSQNVNIGKHRVLLEAWSSKPLAFAAWYVPTRTGKKVGASKLPGRSWSMRTVAYGRPDYAQVYLQSDYTGTPVHCRITVDGRVTATETSEGPFGYIVCPGLTAADPPPTLGP